MNIGFYIICAVCIIGAVELPIGVPVYLILSITLLLGILMGMDIGQILNKKPNVFLTKCKCWKEEDDARLQGES